MAGDNRIDLLELLRKAGHDGDIGFLAEAVRVMAQVLMELDVRQKVGAAPYERSAARQTYRNGYRTRLWDSRVGRIELRIPKLRQGSYFPAILEPRRLALVVATGVKDAGEREVLGLDVGPSEDGAFWMAFLRGLLARGLKGVKLVTSDVQCSNAGHQTVARRF